MSRQLLFFPRHYHATVALVVIALTAEALQGAVKERVYTLGEDDPGMIGNTLVDLKTLDIQSSPTDTEGMLVPMTALNVGVSPTYVDVSDRPCIDGLVVCDSTLGLQFDGVNDTIFGPEFDPRDFETFAALTQAWVKPAVVGGSEQFIFRTGIENGGASIDADGKWTLYMTNGNITASAVSAVADEWAHVAVFRGGNSGSLFVNGTLVARNTGFWGASGPEVTLGSDDLGVGGFFNGIIDNFNVAGFSDFAFDEGSDIDYFPDLNIEFSGVPGDIDQDGVADQDDYDIWAANLGLDNGFGQGDPGTLILGDENQSGIINLIDFQNINQAALNPPAGSGSDATATPEPTTALLLVMASMMLAMVRRSRVWALSIVAVSLALTTSNVAMANVVVAEDFFYDGPTKAIGPGGGFNGFEEYGGGQNGPAGGWDGLWGQIGDGIITTTTFEEPTQQLLALFSGGFGVQDELIRDFTLDASVPLDQTLFFGGQFKVDVPESLVAPRMFLNRVAGNDGADDPPRDRTQDIAIGIEGNTFTARLGDNLDTMTVPTGAAPNDGEWHSVIGKLELNVDGGMNERLSVWYDPTGVETGPDSASVEADVLTDLSALIGSVHMQGSVPGAGENGRSFVDDIAVGTAWDAVSTVDVPRLSLQIDPVDGKARLKNDNSVDLALNGYSIESGSDSEPGSLNPAGWNSLADQGETDWQENSATSEQLVETVFLSSRTVPAGGNVSLGNLFSVEGNQDVTARFATLDGLLNVVADVDFSEFPDVLVGDMNGDGQVNFGDLTPFSLGLTDIPAYDAAFPELADTRVERGDVDLDTFFNFGDLTPFVNLLTGAGGGSSQSVPEPSTCLMLIASVVGLGMATRTRSC